MKYSLLIVALLSTASLLNAFALSDLFGGSDDEASSLEATPAITPTPVSIANTPTIEPIMTPSSNNSNDNLLTQTQRVRVSVVGQGVSPMNTASPAQAYAMAKRAAIADGYRIIAEKVKGVRVEGQDLIENMMIKRSSVRTSVNAMVKNANIVETTYKDGLCEVEMEIVLSYIDFSL